MAVLCGSSPGTSMGKYGGLAIKNGSPHETGLRILLHAIQLAASRHSRVIEPLLSLSVDFYARVFVRVWSSPGAVKGIAAKHAVCYTCSGCGAYHIQPLGQEFAGPKRVVPARGPPVGPLCSECGSPFLVYGPFWNGPLHSREFLRSFLDGLGATPNPVDSENTKQLNSSHEHVPNSDNKSKFPNPTLNTYPLTSELNSPLPSGFSFAPDLTAPQLPSDMSEIFGTFKRIVGMSTVAYEELPDVTLCYRVDHLCAVLGSLVPPMLELYSALLNAGYRVSPSHSDMNVFKTDAPMPFIWDVLIAYRNRLRADEQNNGRTRSESESSESDQTDSSSRSNANTDPDQADSESKRQRKRRLHHANAKDPDETRDSNIVNRQTVREKLLSRPANPLVDFTIHPKANPPSRAAGLLRCVYIL
ncbi:unnamed protein product [Echinostoma caproni]|uniref:tRNA (guanine(26)-N(2))-dimethyltransferase n=1 Tax=Echinostoma caproni TaxID=27848 RepID=A0A183AX72_9TREM|nr:unnamed protein product [Echinostoma caproni]